MRRSLLAVALIVAACAGSALADSFSFGVISDTQDTIGTGTSSTPTPIITAINRQFVAAGVDMVLQPGDLCDNGSVAGEAARLAANTDLTAAGIPFYALRGNHDDNSAAQQYFQQNYIPTSNPNLKVEVSPSDSTSYAITYKDTKFVMLDILATKGTNTAMDAATTWMGGVLTESDHTQAFVLQHKNLLGQNHKDNAFGSGNDSNPVQQNAFFQTLASNNVKYDISGHDHMNHRAIVTSPDGQNTVQQIITQSASTKFYTAGSGFSSRETSISDQQNQIGYYIFSVDGPRVTGKYYSTTPVNSDIPANPVWTLQDTFGYSLNGKQFTVARGGDYAVVQDAISGTKFGESFLGTSMKLSGINAVTATAEGSRPCADDVNTGWTPASGNMISDMLTICGMNNGLGSAATDVYSLTMSFAGSAASPVIEHQNADGSWSLLPTTINGDGTVTASGLTCVGNFAVVPEPATMCLLALGGLALIRRRK